MSSNLENNAFEIISHIVYMNISSITPEGEPWGTPVFTAFDNDLNFYWISWKENQHSQNIESNSHIFTTIYDSTVEIGDGVGVYMKGKARVVVDPMEIGKAVLFLYKRLNHVPKDVSHFLFDYPKRIYKFIPERVWINGDLDTKDGTLDIKREISLEALKKFF